MGVQIRKILFIIRILEIRACLPVFVYLYGTEIGIKKPSFFQSKYIMEGGRHEIRSIFLNLAS